MGQSGDDYVAKGEHIQLLIVSRRIMESFRGHESLCAFYGRLATEGGWVDGSTHAKVAHLGHERDQVQQHVVRSQVVMDERRVLAVEVGEGLYHLTEDERFEVEGELLLAVILQVRAKTGVHLLHDEHW